MNSSLSEWHELSAEELEITDSRPGFRSVARRPLDLDHCLRLYEASLPEKPSTSTRAHKVDLWIRDWCEDGEAILEDLLSAEEAAWWFRASTHPQRLSDDRTSLGSLADARTFSTEPPTAEAAHERLKALASAADQHFTRWPRDFAAPAARALAYLFATDVLVEIFLDVFGLERLGPFVRYMRRDEAARGFVASWFERARWADHALADVLELVRLGPSDGCVEALMSEAAAQKKKEIELEAARLHSEGDRFALTLLGQRRPRWTASRLCECLARSGFEHFEEIAARVATARPADQRDAIGVLARLHTERIVEGMLRLSQKGVVRVDARQWLNREGANAVHRLIELAVSRKREKKPAREILRGYVLDGRADLVRSQAEQFDEKTRQKIDALIDEHADTVPRPELPKSMQSGWFSAIASRADERFAELVERLPELTTREDYRLDRGATTGIVTALSTVDLATRPTGIADSYDAGLASAMELLDPRSAATFSRALFETWVRDQNPPSERWKLFAFGFLHGPASAEFLGDALLQYTRWMGLEDALRALDTLRVWGNARALYEIERVRERTRNGRIREHAELVLEVIACERRLTTKALLDRALLEIDDGDDIDEATRARLRRRIDTTLARRLEAAMASGSTWQPMTWREIFIDGDAGSRVSPLLVWRSVDPHTGDGENFRVDESGECVDVNDEPFELDPWQQVAVAHPADASDAHLTDWSGRFAEYELVQPFDQLNRQVYRFGELAKGFRAPSGRLVDGVDLWGVLRRTGWQAIRVGNDRIGGFERRFEARDTITRLAIDNPFDVMSMRRGGLASRRATLVGLKFFDAQTRQPIDAQWVNPVVFSESHLDVQDALMRLDER